MSAADLRLPERIFIRVLADGSPAPQMFVAVRIKTSRKNDFSSAFGPPDQEGAVRVMRNDLLRAAEAVRRFFIMDYGHPEGDFTGEIVVTPLNREGLKRAIEAYHQYQQFYSYPPQYAEQIQEARILLEELNPKTLSVEVEHDGHPVVVRPEVVAA